MENQILKVYCASGWFSESQESILTNIENYLRSNPRLKPYFPRHDGVKLGANEFHDHKLREKVFMDNLHNIDTADLVIANLDGRDGFQDTGTCYEVGYAMAKGIPVIGYQKDNDGKMNEHLSSIVSEFVTTCTGINDLDYYLSSYDKKSTDRVSYEYYKGSKKALFVAPDNSEKNILKNTEVAGVLIECFGSNFKWVDKLSNTSIASRINDIFDDVNFMVAVIDDRHPIVSWMMGQCFARKIPMISYSNYDYGVNIMLLCSIIQHLNGTDSLKTVVQQIKREGISSLSKMDTSNIKAF